MSVVCTRHNIGQLDEFKAIADRYGAQLRLTRLRPSGRGADVWEELHPLPGAAARALRLAGRARRPGADRRLVLPPRRRTASALPGLNLCGAGRVVCLVDPVGRRLRLPVRDPRPVPGRQRARRSAASTRSGSTPPLFLELRSPQTGGACTHVLGVRLLPGRLHGRQVLHRPAARRPRPRVREGQRGDALAAARPGRRLRATTRTPARSATRPVPLTLLPVAARQGLRREPARRLAMTRGSPSGPRPQRSAGRSAGRRPTGRCCWCRSGRSSSTARTCRSATDTMIANAVTREAARAARRDRPPGAGRAGRRLRRERRARGLPGHHLDRPRGARPAARRARPLGLPLGGRRGLRQRPRRQRARR